MRLLLLTLVVDPPRAHRRHRADQPTHGVMAKDFRERLAQSNRSALKVFQRQGKHEISLGKMQRRA
jgi:hypothetical protein